VIILNQSNDGKNSLLLTLECRLDAPRDGRAQFTHTSFGFELPTGSIQTT